MVLLFSPLFSKFEKNKLNKIKKLKIDVIVGTKHTSDRKMFACNGVPGLAEVSSFFYLFFILKLINGKNLQVYLITSILEISSIYCVSVCQLVLTPKKKTFVLDTPL